jgi:uncharacterized protein (TIGR00251 family)
MDGGFFSWQGDDLHLHVHILPRSSSNSVMGIHNGALKIKLTAPPVDGKANRFLVKFMADEFDVPASHISIVRGESGRNKHLCVSAPVNIPEWLQ